MGCFICGENDYRYVGIDEEGDDLIECAGCAQVQHFAENPEAGIIRIDDDYEAGEHGDDDDDHTEYFMQLIPKDQW